MQQPHPEAARRRNARIGALCALFAVGMVGAAYASVPLYRLFCQVTGFDGTVRKAEVAPGVILDRTMLVRFDANVRELPWTFNAEQTRQEIRIGETGLAFFKVTNTSDRPLTGMASYNVVPERAGPHFRKIECFCFEQQTIAPGATVEYPVAYFVDPELATDPDAKGVQEITLSYTFFPAEQDQPKAAE